MSEHQLNCPRSQFWDAGEFEAPCTCGATKAAMTEPTEYEKRIQKKQAREDNEAAEQTERDRQDYLRRTGRTEMKP